MLRNVTVWTGFLLVMLLATACGGDKSVYSLEVGDCFDDSPSQAAEVEELTKPRARRATTTRSTRSPTTLQAATHRIQAPTRSMTTASATASVSSSPTSESTIRSPA